MTKLVERPTDPDWKPKPRREPGTVGEGDPFAEVAEDIAYAVGPMRGLHGHEVLVSALRRLAELVGERAPGSRADPTDRRGSPEKPSPEQVGGSA